MEYRLPLLFSIFGFCSPSLYDQRRFHYIDLKMNWTDAQHYCRVKYTDLATIESDADSSKLNRPDTSFAWIGLTDDPVSWKNTMGKDRNSWRWSSTGEISESSYQHWPPTLPDKFNGEQFCVKSTKSGRWADRKCSQPSFFACYNASNPESQKTYVVIETMMTWTNAQTYCRTHYTDLAMIENAEEDNALISAKGLHYVWIGLYRNVWKWSNNRESSYRNWRKDLPDNLVLDQYCVLTTPFHDWWGLECTAKLAFWCEQVPLQKKILKMKIHTDADLSDPAINTQLLQQVGAMLSEKNGHVNVKWKIQPRKQEGKPKANHQCPAR